MIAMVQTLNDHVSAETFWSKVTKTDGCWIWPTPDSRTGYGRIGARWAHRISYEIHVGPIPEAFQIDHLCRNRACVNPEHLEAVTQRENILRSDAPNAIAQRTGMCHRGHILTDANRASNGKGAYTCRECKQERDRRNYQARTSRKNGTLS